MRRMLLPLLLSLPACDSGPAAAAASGDGSGSGGDGGSEAPCCSAEVPVPWRGPALLYRGAAAPPECAAPWANPGPAGGDQLVVEGTCQCTCSEPSGAVCDTPGKVTMYDDTGCANPIGIFTPWKHCTSSSGAPFAASALADPLTVLGGQCQPQLSDDYQTPTWSEQLRVCELAASCDASLCQPAGACIHRPGVHLCPDERYTERTVLYTDLVDERSCSECNCSQAVGQSCPGTIELWPAEDCSGAGAAIDLGSAGVCTSEDLAFNVRGYRVLVGDPAGGDCPATGGEPLGSATAVDPHTVCCEPT